MQTTNDNFKNFDIFALVSASIFIDIFGIDYSNLVIITNRKIINNALHLFILNASFFLRNSKLAMFNAETFL